MKKLVSVIVSISILLAISGCGVHRKELYLPEANNDKLYVTLADGKIHKGDGYSITIPDKKYRYESEFDDGRMEESWERINEDDAEIKVTIYKNSDAFTAINQFAKEHEEYIYEDLVGGPLYGASADGDVIWFHQYENEGTIYIVSREHPKNASEELQKELATIVKSFTFAE